MKKIVILMSKNHGSNQQLLSIARHVYSQYEVRTVHARLRSNAPLLFRLYHIIIGICDKCGTAHPLSRLLKRLTLKTDTVVVHDDDLVLAKTGRFEFPARLLAAGSRARTIYLGQPRRMGHQAFNCLVATPSTPAHPHHIFLDLLPTPFSYDEFQRHATPAAANSIWVMLFGGNARGYDYSEQTWQRLVQDMVRLAKIHTIRWRISTSPRTGFFVEALLKQTFSSEADSLAELICWGDSQRKSVADCLNGAELVFVTEDSASMLCEALNSRLATISIRPDNAGYNPLTTPLAEHHQHKGSLLRSTCSALASIDPQQWRASAFQPLSQCWTEQWRQQDQCLPSTPSK